MAISNIDREKCIQCGMCENYCPMDVIRTKNGVPEIKYVQDCMLCCLCEVRCPAKAITVTPNKEISPMLAWG
ncbi:MAG: hypothetical protein ATN35_03345 [Epulopiscium sp. Nele67-Bin004]|nr:MAG: hypothetical protein ATN35_03345 [Epulopiscium sp. Nele67-Bin004]